MAPLPLLAFGQKNYFVCLRVRDQIFYGQWRRVLYRRTTFPLFRTRPGNFCLSLDESVVTNKKRHRTEIVFQLEFRLRCISKEPNIPIKNVYCFSAAVTSSDYDEYIELIGNTLREQGCVQQKSRFA
jgi:hypothetical protein